MYFTVLMLHGYGHAGAYCFREGSWTAIDAEYKFVKKRFIARCLWKTLSIEPTHKLKIDQKKLQNCKSNILNLVNVL